MSHSHLTAMHNKDFPRHLYAKLKRMKREEKDMTDRLAALRKQCFSSQTEVEATHATLSDSLDDQHELTLRVIEAKLALQQSYNERGDLRREIGMLKGEVFRMQQETRDTANRVSEQRCKGFRKMDDADDLLHTAEKMMERRTEKERQLVTDEQRLYTTKSEAEREEIELHNMDARYDLMRATVQNVLLRDQQQQAAPPSHHHHMDPSHALLGREQHGAGSTNPEPLLIAPKPSP